MSIYMAVTTDKYEHPVCVVDTGAELARWLGISKDCLYSAISKGLSGKTRGYKIVKVDIDD